MLRAVIFVPTEDPAHARWVLVCGDHCRRRGYLLTAIVGDWADVAAMVKYEEVDIVVAARWDHLPPDRLPRLEIPAGECADLGALHAQPPRIIRRGDANLALRRPQRLPVPRTWEDRLPLF